MKKMKFNTVAARTVATCFSLGLLMAAQSAAACTLQNWSGVSGLTDADNAGGPTDGISRYSGVCAMQTVVDTETWVEDNSPGPDGIERIRARFYVLANNSADAVIYRGFDGGGAIFEVSLGADGVVKLASGGAEAQVVGNSGKWNSIEIDWDAGGDLSLVVNGQSAPPRTGAAAGMVDSVRLGNLEGVAGTLTFDAYESRRSTEIGRLLVGDANASGTVNVVDASAIVSELDGTLQSGQPDCNENGVVNIVDASCVITLL